MQYVKQDFMVELGENGLRWERLASYGKRELKAFCIFL
jgi:hypothetical protein